jgi:hypothetical protein
VVVDAQGRGGEHPAGGQVADHLEGAFAAVRQQGLGDADDRKPPRCLQRILQGRNGVDRRDRLLDPKDRVGRFVQVAAQIVHA